MSVNYQPSPISDSDIPFGFVEADGVHDQAWQEQFQADEASLRNRGFTSDFCGAWNSFWQLIAREYSPEIETRWNTPAAPLLESARLSYMALMSAAVRADKSKARLRRFKCSAALLWSYRSGELIPDGEHDDPERRRVQKNFARYWRGENGWRACHRLQVATGLPFFDRTRRTFKGNEKAAEAAFYTDSLTDLFGEIVRRKNSYRGTVRVERFNRATREALALFRREAAHKCENRETCQRPHLYAPEAKTDSPEVKGNNSKSGAAKKQRAKIINFAQAKEKILSGIEIATARANAGKMTAEEADELILLLAPLVEIASSVRESSDGTALNPSEDVTHPVSADSPEFVARGQNEKSDFPQQNEETGEVHADKNIRMEIQPENVTTDDFLAAFVPDPCEEINLRAFKPKEAPESEERFAPRKERTFREALSCADDLQKSLAELNKTRGLYFVVNGGGDRDDEITNFRACFAEMDEKTLAEQHAIFDAAPIPPTIRVETRKSVHSYWLLKPGATAAEWRELQARLIQYFKSDPKIKNPSRVMRLPGFNHVRYSNGLLSYKPVVVAAFDPTRKFAIGELLAAFPSVVKPRRPQPASSLDAFSDFEGRKRELGARIAAHPTAKHNGRGKWDARAVCHDGKGATGLFYDPSKNVVWCNAGCDIGKISRAFGLRSTGGIA
jgi:hypothetical protein